jgi:hypothetical protein
MASKAGGIYAADLKTASRPDRCNQPAYLAIGDDELLIWLCSQHYDLLMKAPQKPV